MSSLMLIPLILMTTSFHAAPPLSADLVLKNGKIWTVDPALPEAQAVAVWRDRILVVGSDADVAGLVGPKTRIIDLQGKRAVPGFYDSHTHMLAGGQLLSLVNLKD